jgi:radical SAM protein with 4Fe4S-binding SPASM domain
LLSDLAAAKVRDIAFSGGEPLLRTDLEDLMRFGAQLGITNFSLVTNGILATPERARSLAQAGLRSVQVSLDGVDAADHCEVRKAKIGDYYRATRAIRLFRDLGVTVDIACILSPRNATRAPEMALFAESLGARGLRYCSFVPAGRAQDSEIQKRFAMTESQMDDFVRFMQKLAAHPDPPIRIMMDHGIGPWRSSGAFQCDAGTHVAYTSSEGTLYPCSGVIFDEFAVGNVFETPVSQLLVSEKMRRPRAIARRDINGMCASCSNSKCSGGCRGAAFAVTASPCGEPTYCFFRPQPELHQIRLDNP